MRTILIVILFLTAAGLSYLNAAEKNIPAEQTDSVAASVNGDPISVRDILAETARHDIDAARRKLCDELSSYAGYTKCRLVVVFDGYKQKGNPGEKSQFHNIQVVYTKEGETADAYIESIAAEIGNNYAVRVASSDSLVQISSFRSGVLRMSSRELLAEVETTRAEMAGQFSKG